MKSIKNIFVTVFKDCPKFFVTYNFNSIITKEAYYYALFFYQSSDECSVINEAATRWTFFFKNGLFKVKFFYYFNYLFCTWNIFVLAVYYLAVSYFAEVSRNWKSYSISGQTIEAFPSSTSLLILYDNVDLPS
jgi:hypothetical protein